jgi:hypothetical protein
LLVAAVAVTFVACSDSDDDDDDASGSTTTTEATEESSTTTTTPAVVTSVADAPATSNYVGARKDVSDLTCEQDGGKWKVGGTVTNPSDAPVNYRIYTSFLDDSNETRGLLQTDIGGVAPGEEREWSGELELDADDLTCGLRVERTGIDGAPPPTDPPTTAPSTDASTTSTP